MPYTQFKRRLYLLNDNHLFYLIAKFLSCAILKYLKKTQKGINNLKSDMTVFRSLLVKCI